MFTPTMLALSPPLFSTFGWPLEEPIIQELNDIIGETETSDSFLPSPLSIPQTEVPDSTLFGATRGDTPMVKKLNHNANERDRRKRINSLYSSLRSLLPASDQSKKLSIPATVSRVLKYIPDLQKEVEKLVQRKEELESRFSRQEDLVKCEKQRKVPIQSSLLAVSASQIGDREVVVQISTLKVNKCSSLSDVLLILEEDGDFLLLNASTLESFGERVFYTLHLQVQGAQNMEIELLRQKLLSLYQKKL